MKYVTKNKMMVAYRNSLFYDQGSGDWYVVELPYDLCLTEGDYTGLGHWASIAVFRCIFLSDVTVIEYDHPEDRVYVEPVVGKHDVHYSR